MEGVTGISPCLGLLDKFWPVLKVIAMCVAARTALPS